jgi:hypothetical protein
VWQSPIGASVQDHGTDLGPSRLLGRERGSRLMPTGRPVGTVGLEEVTAQEGGRLIHEQSQAIQSASGKWAR